MVLELTTANIIAILTLIIGSSTISSIQLLLSNVPLPCSCASIFPQTTSFGTLGPRAPLRPNAVAPLGPPPGELDVKLLFIRLCFIAFFFMGNIGQGNVIVQ